MARIYVDKNGRKILVIDTIRFKGKKNINWDEVRDYLRSYVGEYYEITDTADVIYIGKDFPNEYTGSNYTYQLKGMAAKAKANAAQGIPSMIEIATGKHFRENHEKKHARNAKYGWYRYDSHFALPVLDEQERVERYNVFHASMLVRHDEDGKLYLYDILDIKKETGNPLES